MNAEAESLARIAGIFSDVEIDRDDYPVQHPELLAHAAIATAAILFVIYVIGMWWCLSLWLVPTICVSIMNGAALAGALIFNRWERS